MSTSTPKPPAQPEKALVAVGSTGKDAEAFIELAIAKKKPKPKAVMTLSPGGEPHASVPDLRPGDRLLVSAEVELTADHAEKKSDSVGTPYGFEPNVELTLLLCEVGAGVVTPGPKAILLKADGRALSHRRHHDVVVFDNIAFDIPAGGLPWKGQSVVRCTIAAWHSGAKGGEKLIIGQNNAPSKENPQGKPSGDMSGLSVARIRPGIGAVPAPMRRTKALVNSIPVQIDVPHKKIVYSLRLEKLKAGEQLRIRAGLKTNCKRFGQSTRTTVEVLLSEGENSIDPGAEAKRICPESPQISRGNGKNTLPEDSAMDSAKIGVMRIDKDAKKTLFANVMVTTGDPLKKATSGGQILEILDGGFLAVTRYPTEISG